MKNETEEQLKNLSSGLYETAVGIAQKHDIDPAVLVAAMGMGILQTCAHYEMSNEAVSDLLDALDKTWLTAMSNK